MTFAWFDTHPQEADAILWADPLTDYHETDQPEIAQVLLAKAEAEARRCPSPPADAPGAGPVWAFALDYECAPWFDPAFAAAFRDRPPGRLRLWRFAQSEALPSKEAEARASLRIADPTAGFLDWQAAWQEADFVAAVERIHAYLRAGDAYQINLTFPWYARYYGEPLALYLRLRTAQPVPYGAYLPIPGGGAILCRSPELFFRRTGNKIVCRPMKGTTRPGIDGWVDAKTQAENVMIVDLIRNDLGRLAPPGGVRVSELFTIERYATLQQLTSTVVAGGVEAPLWTILAALFPCGSVTGAPKRRALEIIAELEPAPRGVYCGAIGVLLPGGDLQVAVPIRTLEVTADRRATLGVGCGIVIDSEPHTEWQEALLKTRFARTLPAAVGLIETLRWQGPEGSALLSYHEARLRASAAALGIPFDPAAWQEALAAATRNASPGTDVRLRVVLQPDGTLTASVTPFVPAALLPVSVVLAVAPVIDERDPLQRHKTNRRAHYDRLLAEVTAQGHFDALVCNRRGELVEGCRSTLFVRFPGDPLLHTPPLASGALAGVLRAHLIATGQAVERRLTPQDLAAAETLFLGNAVQGLLPARLVR